MKEYMSPEEVADAPWSQQAGLGTGKPKSVECLRNLVWIRRRLTRKSGRLEFGACLVSKRSGSL